MQLLYAILGDYVQRWQTNKICTNFYKYITYIVYSIPSL